jgi:hypothetical protein
VTRHADEEINGSDGHFLPDKRTRGIVGRTVCVMLANLLLGLVTGFRLKPPALDDWGTGID